MFEIKKSLNLNLAPLDFPARCLFSFDWVSFLLSFTVVLFTLKRNFLILFVIFKNYFDIHFKIVFHYLFLEMNSKDSLIFFLLIDLLLNISFVIWKTKKFWNQMYRFGESNWKLKLNDDKLVDENGHGNDITIVNWWKCEKQIPFHLLTWITAIRISGEFISRWEISDVDWSFFLFPLYFSVSSILSMNSNKRSMWIGK